MIAIISLVMNAIQKSHCKYRYNVHFHLLCPSDVPMYHVVNCPFGRTSLSITLAYSYEQNVSDNAAQIFFDATHYLLLTVQIIMDEAALLNLSFTFKNDTRLG